MLESSAGANEEGTLAKVTRTTVLEFWLTKLFLMFPNYYYNNYSFCCENQHDITLDIHACMSTHALSSQVQWNLRSPHQRTLSVLRIEITYYNNLREADASQ